MHIVIFVIDLIKVLSIFVIQNKSPQTINMKRLLSLILLLSMGQVGFSTNLELWKKASTSELNQLGNATIKTKSSVEINIINDVLFSCFVVLVIGV